MDYIQKTLWSASGHTEPGSIVVVVAEITERSVTISEETSTSSQQVCCSRSKMMETLNVHSEEELLIELQNRFGNVCGFGIAKQFMEEKGIEFNWWGGSN